MMMGVWVVERVATGELISRGKSSKDYCRFFLQFKREYFPFVIRRLARLVAFLVPPVGIIYIYAFGPIGPKIPSYL
jgi:hypothetical protein